MEEKQVEREELVDIISEAARSIFEEILMEPVAQTSQDVILSPSSMNGYGVVLGLAEDFIGNTIINLPKDLAEYFTSKMNGMDIKEIGDEKDRTELVEGTIGEIVNMVGGRAITEFDNYNVRCDITPPTIFFGEQMKLISRGQIVYLRRYTVNKQELKLFITLKKNPDKTD